MPPDEDELTEHCRHDIASTDPEDQTDQACLLSCLHNSREEHMMGAASGEDDEHTRSRNIGGDEEDAVPHCLDACDYGCVTCEHLSARQGMLHSSGACMSDALPLHIDIARVQRPAQAQTAACAPMQARAVALASSPLYPGRACRFELHQRAVRLGQRSAGADLVCRARPPRALAAHVWCAAASTTVLL